ncbi:MAG TPA: DUF433 domain-containing protein [Polyangia bacterium]
MTDRRTIDPREVPNYTVVEAAAYLRLPPTTIRRWIAGQAYGTKSGGPRRAAPVIETAAGRPPLLSFWNLVELFVLASIRRHHNIPLQKVRKALRYVRREFGTPRPLAHEDFLTDGVELFIEKCGKLIAASGEGQMAVRRLLEATLRRIERDPQGLAQRLFPWSRQPDEPTEVEIDPRRAFGRLIIAGTGVPTEVIAERLRAGDSVSHLAEDYRLEVRQVEAALRWELGRALAA